MPVPSTSSTPTLRQRLAVASLVAAPLLIVVGNAMAPKDSSNAAVEVARYAAHRDRIYLGYVLFAIGATLFVPASTALARLFRGRGSHVGVVSCTLMAVGGVSIAAGISMQNTVEWILTEKSVNPSTATQVTHLGEHSASAGSYWIVGALLFIGMAGVAGTLLHAKTAPWWQAALLVVGGATIFISGSGPTSFIATPVVIASALLAWTISHLDDTEPAPAATVDLTGAVPAQAGSVDVRDRAEA